MKKYIFSVLILLAGFNHLFAQKEIKLTASGETTLTAYFPVGNLTTKTAILVIPGGGYGSLAMETEGTPIAEAFAAKGITAFVLKYRLPGEVKAAERSTAPLQDAQEAMKYIRENAEKYNIDINKVGVIGFSAGGHLAATLETKHGKNCIVNSKNTKLRPDFAILVYPVITMDAGLTHLGSREKLIGTAPTEVLINLFSSEKQVTRDTAPTYITHASDDQIVDFHNSILMYEALVKNNVPAELHLYPKGDHGFIQRLPLAEWLDPILLFIKKQGFYN